MIAPSKSWIGLFVCCVLLAGCGRGSEAQTAAVEKTTQRSSRQPQATGVTITLSPDIAETPVSGRLLVLFSKRNPTPITGPNWFSPEQCAGIDVVDWNPGAKQNLHSNADAFPQPLLQMTPGKYIVQAVLKRNPDFAHHKDGVGNLYSKPRSVKVDRAGIGEITLELNRQIDVKPVASTPNAKIFSHRSDLLSAFHKRVVVDRALVLLPKSYDTNPEKTYPVFYEVTGFGPTVEDMLDRHKHSAVTAAGVEFIHVYLTGQCEWGHHVYANSDTNGPRGDALVHEMIPAIEAQFRAVAQPHARLLGGHSSGGWASLWLQTQYPKFFGGVWSTSPDPVDFRDWQGTNLYQHPANIFTDGQGKRRPLAIAGGKTMIWYDDFSKMDDVLQRGGQLRSFEAVFSPSNDAGLPARCWDRVTGEIDAAIFDHWKSYDISQHLASNWPTLKDDLAGKLHVFTGDQDTFLLTEAVRLLKQRLEKLGSDAQIEILPDRDHFNLFEAGLQDRIYRSLAEKYIQGATADASTSR